MESSHRVRPGRLDGKWSRDVSEVKLVLSDRHAPDRYLAIAVRAAVAGSCKMICSSKMLTTVRGVWVRHGFKPEAKSFIRESTFIDLFNTASDISSRQEISPVQQLGFEVRHRILL